MLNLTHLAALVEEYPEAVNARVREFSVGSRVFAFNERPALMGVVNLSPDSWYRESVCLNADAAIERGRVLAAQGAAILDLGAESTLAHAARVDASAQASVLLPVIRTLATEGFLVSAETYEPSVARPCLEAGARVLNLTRAAGADEMYHLAAAHEAAVILCYVQGEHVRNVGDFELTGDPVARMREHFARETDRAARCGVTRMFIDPGLGFYYRNLRDSATRVRHQMRTFLHTFRLRTLGWPVCQALPHAFEYFRDEVRCAEPFFAVLAALGRTDLFRTHEVPRTRAVLETLTTFEPA